ncbi:hypothetical protein [Phascolarctobacterium faecium]|jgi:hypothetical protein|uniref:hypothetical protein n=1 Tax=Phascolarctobacterium faecium TaxID=33025 RepID=UPI003AF0EA64
MTKLEMLRYARKGIAAEMDREEEIIKIMKKDSGREAVCLKRLEKLKKDYAEIQNLIKSELLG